MANNDLKQYVRTNKAQGFKSEPYVSAEGDFVTFFISNEDHYAKRVDKLLTVYLSMKTNRLVGCKFKGVKRILETIKRLDLGKFDAVREVEDGQDVFQLRLLAFPGMALAHDQEQQELYDEVEEATRDIRFDARQLEFA